MRENIGKSQKSILPRRDGGDKNGGKAGEKLMAGMEFVKKIGKVGCIMFGLIFVLYMITCFAPQKDRLAGYSPPETGEYYAEHINELERELEDNVLPLLGEGVNAGITDDGKIEIAVPKDSFWEVRRDVLKHFDQSLFEFTEKGGEE